MKKILTGGICLIAIISGFGILAYGQDFTHPHLARETGKFYSYFFSENKLLVEELEWLARGDKEEDKSPRYVNHFYNPLTNEPWLGANPVAITAKDWANNRDAQKRFAGGDQTFEQAIYLYRDGQKRESFIALGHILHLIEDMTVPEHTRNDTHVPGSGTESPYEDWAEKYNQNNKDEIAKELISGGKKMSPCFNLENCFDEAAYYSNRYFFSIDTVDEFENPKIVRWEKEKTSGVNVSYGYGLDENGVEFKLVSKGATELRNFNKKTPYKLDDAVLSDYYSRLSRKSVVVGAKVIQLFFDEIARQDAENIPNVRPISFLEKFSNKIKSLLWFLPQDLQKTTAMNEENKETEEIVGNNIASQEKASETQPEPSSAEMKARAIVEKNVEIALEPAPEENNPIGKIYFAFPEENNQPPASEPTPLQQAIAKYGDGFGGTYAPQDPPLLENKDNQSSAESTEIPLANPEPLIDPSETEEFATSTEELTGESADEETEEETNATSTKITGIHTVISEIKIAGEKKNDEFVELYNPTDSDINLSGWKLRPFSKSGKEKSYLLRPFPESADIKSKGYYLIAHEEYGGEIVADSLYSATESLASNNGLILYNDEGNIIDVVGWGDLDSAEIYETSPAMKIPDGSSLERKANENSTAESMSAGGTDEFAGNSYDSDNNLNDFVLRGQPYPQNSNSKIEPRDEEIESEPEPEPEPAALPVPTYLYGKISNTVMTLSRARNPYVVPADFFVDKTAKLIIEPGVVIKFGKEFQSTWMKFPTSLHIAGSLEINGTEENPVIFTSILDDAYGGDTNGDSELTSPAMDDWGAVFIESEADQTIDITHAKFFYGGASSGTATGGAVFVSRGGVVVNVSGCYFANNRTAISNFGWKNKLSKPINITRTLMENNIKGIFLDIFAPIAIQRSTIRNNSEYGIYLEAYAPDVFFMEESNIYGNGQFAMRNFYGSRLKENGLKLANISARNNWWGDASGPSPSWKTNKAQDKIDFSNWLTEEYNWQETR